MKTIVSSGPSTLFRGAAASAARDAPYAGIFLVFYEKIKRKLGALFYVDSNVWTSNVTCLSQAASSPTLSPSAAVVINGLSGAGAGLLATTVTHPFDVIKATNH